jgi:hypothetical protein
MRGDAAVIQFLISAIVATAIGLGFEFASGHSFSWITIALFVANAALVFQHGVKWLQGKMDTFDPMGMFGIFGIVFFLISPAFQIAHDFWPFIPSLSQSTAWINIWAAMNLAGIVIYLWAVQPQGIHPRQATLWEFDRQRLKIVLAAVLVFCFAMQVYVYMQFGGISGFIRTFTQRQQLDLGMSDHDPLQGFGVPTVLAESFKYIFAMTIIYWARGKPFAKRWWFFASIMPVFFIVFMIFGGLRGSRSNTVFSLIFAAGMYHYWIRPLKVRTVIVGILFIAVFLNAYYWYKIAGTNGLQALVNPEYRQSYVTARRDAELYIVSRDFGRMDIQTLAMREYNRQKLPYFFGATYASSIFTVVPTALLPIKPNYVLEAKSNIIFGRGRFVPGDPRETTIVLGLIGEAFVNFSYLGILVAFGLLGWGVRTIRRLIYGLAATDVRRLLLPVLCLLPLQILITDSGVVVMLIVRSLLVPLIVVLLCVRRKRVRLGSPIALPALSN